MMHRRGRASLVERYHGLIGRGVYSNSSGHGPRDRQFFAEVLTPFFDSLPARPVAILECGCGSGEWLDEAGRLARASRATAVELAGFDVTPGMVDLARERLRDRASAERLLAADVLDPQVYATLGGTFDLVLPGQTDVADIGYDTKRGRVLVPRMTEHTVEAHDLK
jgi:SAM-dependent methyltransferase